ncbi:MAG: 50S ribosomal protein L3 N(5)-glutamine methyltransferase [Xanthomonadales bacterium]|nr:50S ribosomal protein L3 N(5)-glutamine methyltransferase [Xanthomonadales bacterium]
MDISESIIQTQQSLEASDVFYGHGTDNSADEALWLVQAAFAAVSPDSEITADTRVSVEFQNQLDEYLKLRIEQHTPVAYITGEVWFCDLAFKVSPAVLVPRSPIAELIREGFQPWVVLDPGSKILDLCTGSACIACAIAVYLPDSRVEAADISTDALQLARENSAQHNLSERLKIIHSDLFSALEGKKYQLIVSNPPYVSNAEYADLPAEYLQEPKLGLTSGADGLDLVVQMLAEAADYLNADGVLICEVGASQAALESVFPQLPFLWLEFTRGGEGVFILQRDQLVAAKQDIMQEQIKRHRNTLNRQADR